MDFTNLKEAVAAVIKTNGNQEITGAVLQNVLNTIITTMGAGRTFVGVATPTTTAINPLPDGNVFYITKGYGSFVDFDVTVPQGEIYIIQNTETGWQGISLMKSPDALVGVIDDQGQTIANQGETIANQGKAIANQGKTIANQGEAIARQEFEIARQELTMPAWLESAPDFGAEVQGDTLVIPVGNSGIGSHVGAKTGLNLDFGILQNQIEDCTVVGLVQITGNQAEIDDKISQYSEEYWTTPGGEPANLVNTNILLFEKLSDNIFMTVVHMSGVTEKKTASGNTFYGIKAGVIVGPGNVTEEMRITPLAASHYSVRLVDSEPEQFGNYVVKKLIGDALTVYNYGQPSTIVVSADPNDTDSRVSFKGKNAIQNALDSITDNSPTKRYRIYVKQGLYKITNSSEFLGYLGYPCMVCMKDYVDIEGADRDNTIVWAELPYYDADIDVSANGQRIPRDRHQTLWNYAKDAYVKHITLVGKNLRCTIHHDDGRSSMYKRGYEDVKVIFTGARGVRPWDLGLYNGETNEVKGGLSVSSIKDAWRCNNKPNSQYPTKWRLENHTTVTELSETLFMLLNNGSLINDFWEMVGCSWGGKGYILDYDQYWYSGDENHASFNHAEWRIIGYGNDPFLFSNNAIRGVSLRIISNSTGDDSKVRFVSSGDVYAKAIKNPRQNADVTLFLPETLYTDGYIVRDGSEGLSGWANGCVDLSEEIYANDAGVNYTRFGLRLGDCSTTHKTLTINIDGTDYNVVFDKDYTNMTNAAILAEINAVISAVATATFVYYGRSYYPEMPDVSEIVYNESTSDYIPKGTVLKKVNGRVSPAEDGDIIAGVALDDIPVFNDIQGVATGTGRMLKRGYISTDGTQPFFVNAWNGTNTDVAIGDRLKVDAGRLVVDPAGTVTVKAANVVAINCN